MADESPNQNAYAVVLADLRARRAEIDATIAALEKLMSLGGSVAVGAPAPASMNPPVDAVVPGIFLGLSIVDASKKLLGMRRRQMGTAEITDAIQAGGLVLTSDNPANVVGSVLNRHASKTGEIIRTGRGQWALAEWMPNPQRFRNKSGATSKDEPEGDTGETAPEGETLAIEQAPSLKIVQ